MLHVLWPSPASDDLAANGDVPWRVMSNLVEREKIGFDLAARDCDGVSVVELIHAAGARAHPTSFGPCAKTS